MSKPSDVRIYQPNPKVWAVQVKDRCPCPDCGNPEHWGLAFSGRSCVPRESGIHCGQIQVMSRYRRLRGIACHVLPVLRGETGGHFAAGAKQRALFRWSAKYNREVRRKGLCTWCRLPTKGTYWHTDCQKQMLSCLGQVVSPTHPTENPMCDECGRRHQVCYICGEAHYDRKPGDRWVMRFEIEHEYPIHRGREQGMKALISCFLLENIKWACEPCHRAKTASERKDSAKRRRELKQPVLI